MRSFLPKIVSCWTGSFGLAGEPLAEGMMDILPLGKRLSRGGLDSPRAGEVDAGEGAERSVRYLSPLFSPWEMERRPDASL